MYFGEVSASGTCVYVFWNVRLSRSIYELYAQGMTYDELHASNRTKRFKWMQYIEDTSFKFFVKAYNHTIPQARQREIINSFSYMSMLGKIDMKNPGLTMGCFEECALLAATSTGYSPC